jgi:hypothetical protein
MGQSTQFDDSTASSEAHFRRGVAWFIVISGCLLLSGVIVMAFARRGIPIPDAPDSEPWFSGLFNALGTLSLLATGGYLTLKMPRNNLAWLMLLAGLGYALHLFAVGYTYISYLVAPEPLALTKFMFILAPIGWALCLPSIPMIILLFPAGRLPSPRWRFTFWVWAGIVIVMSSLYWQTAEGAFTPFPNPFWREGPLSQAILFIVVAAWFSFIGLSVLALVSAVVRGRRAQGLERQQYKWLIFAGFWTAALLIWGNYNSGTVWAYAAKAMYFAAIPLAIAVAVARYRLWDLDLVVRRTTQYALLTVILALVYFGSIVLLERLLLPLTGESDIAVVLSTLLIAALFLPLRRRVQGIIDQRFFGRKYDAEKVLQQFAATARDETNLDALTAELLRVIQETMQPEHVSVWLRPTTEDIGGK